VDLRLPGRFVVDRLAVGDVLDDVARRFDEVIEDLFARRVAARAPTQRRAVRANAVCAGGSATSAESSMLRPSGSRNRRPYPPPGPASGPGGAGNSIPAAVNVRAASSTSAFAGKPNAIWSIARCFPASSCSWYGSARAVRKYARPLSRATHSSPHASEKNANDRSNSGVTSATWRRWVTFKRSILKLGGNGPPDA
jgi:hypothetical protein